MRPLYKQKGIPKLMENKTRRKIAKRKISKIEKPN